jgi:hypothetical protein
MQKAGQYPLNPAPISTKKSTQQKSIAGRIQDHFVQHAIEYATYTALSYMATSQLRTVGAPIRIIGIIGLRAIPIIAVGSIAWNIYETLSD